MTLQCVWKLGLTGNAIMVLTGGVTSPTINGMDGEFASMATGNCDQHRD